MVKLSEVLESYKRKAHRLEVWEGLVGSLYQYTDSEGGGGDKEYTTVNGVVPPGVISSVIEEINSDIVAPLKAELETMEGLEVAGGQEEKGKARSGQEGQKEEGSKGGKKPAAPRKLIVPGRGGRGGSAQSA